MAKRGKRKSEAFAYGSVLDALGQGLYPDKRHVIREFVQNACDAVRELQRATGTKPPAPIEVRIAKPSITIYDRGIGMDRRLMEQYRYVGFSEKDVDENVGFRGIGKISGIAVARKIIVTSSRLDVPKRFRVEIHADEMLAKVQKDRNPPLESLMRDFTQLTTADDKKEKHFTLVELHDIRDDSIELYNTEWLRAYLQRNLPLPLDPAFPFGRAISDNLHMNIPDFFEVDVSLDGERLYKPYLANCLDPEFERVFADDTAEGPLLAYCWYCMHASTGQFPEKETRGLVYRFKNFAVGSPQLPRETLWEASPERAFYFFGEVHALDNNLVPASDRDEFEDNHARKRMHQRCKRIARVLNQKAYVASDRSRFDTVLGRTEASLAQRGRELDQRELPTEIRTDVQFEIRKALENVSERLKRASGKRAKTARDTALIARGTKVQKRAARLLRRLSQADSEAGFFDILKKVPLGHEAKALYRVVVEVLREELESEPARLERILKALHARIGQRLG
jgi:molecular chaperone HtpG